LITITEQRIARVASALIGGSLVFPFLLLLVLLDVAGDRGAWRYLLIAAVTAYGACAYSLTRVDGAPRSTRVRIWAAAVAFHVSFVLALSVVTSDPSVALVLGVVEAITASLCIWGLLLAYRSAQAAPTVRRPGT
jgi:hypothetical protein